MLKLVIGVCNLSGEFLSMCYLLLTLFNLSCHIDASFPVRGFGFPTVLLALGRLN